MAVTLRLVSSIQTLCRIKLSLRSMQFTITKAARKNRRESCALGLYSSHNVECIWSAEIKGNNLHIFDTLSYIFLVRFCVQTISLITAWGGQTWATTPEIYWVTGQAFQSGTYIMLLYLALRNMKYNS